MEMEEFDFAEMMAKIVMDARRKKRRRDAAQQVVKTVVGRVGWFNGNAVPKFLRAYHAKMTKWGVDEATGLEYFCRVLSVSMQKEIKEPREAHDLWEFFEGALLEAYGYAKPESVCRQHYEKRSATTRHASSGQERVVSDYALPPEEGSTCNGLEQFDLEALVSEAYKIVKAQIEAEEGSTMGTGPRGSEHAEENTSLYTEDRAYVEPESERYIGTTGEGAERTTCHDMARLEPMTLCYMGRALDH